MKGYMVQVDLFMAGDSQISSVRGKQYTKDLLLVVLQRNST